MNKLLPFIKTSQDFYIFCEVLSQRLSNNKPISSNPMYDGFIVGLILTTTHAKDLFLGELTGKILDGTHQKLEKIATWSMRNKTMLQWIWEVDKFGLMGANIRRIPIHKRLSLKFAYKEEYSNVGLRLIYEMIVMHHAPRSCGLPYAE